MASGAVTAAPLAISIPSDLSIDMSKLMTGQKCGLSYTEDAAIAGYDGECYVSTTTSIGLSILGSGGAYATSGAITNVIPFTFATGDYATMTVKVPILGWGASTQMSDSFEGRNITAEVYRSSAQGSQAITATTQKIIFGAKIKDSVNSFDTTLSRYTILSAGDYKFTPRLSFNALGANGQSDLLLYKNGSGYKTITSGFTTAGANHNLTTTFVAENCVAGDYFEIFISCSTTMQMLSAATILGGSQLSIEKSQGSQSIAANDNINCRYSTAAGQSIGVSAPIILFGSKSYDSHGFYNPATGVFTSNIAGKFSVKAKITTAIATYATSTEVECLLYKNGTQYSELGRQFGNGTNIVLQANGSDTVDLLAGGTIDIRGYSNVTTTLLTNVTSNYLVIEKVG